MCLGSYSNLLSIRNTLLSAFKKKISSKVIIGLWRRVLKNTKEYFKSDENIWLINDEFNAYSSSNEDHITWRDIYILSFSIYTDNI